jgi:hypothetical protein
VTVYHRAVGASRGVFGVLPAKAPFDKKTNNIVRLFWFEK